MRLQLATTVVWVLFLRVAVCPVQAVQPLGPRGSASPDLLGKAMSPSSSVRAASITAPLCSIKLTSTEVLEGGVSVLSVHRPDLR